MTRSLFKKCRHGYTVKELIAETLVERQVYTLEADPTFDRIEGWVRSKS